MRCMEKRGEGPQTVTMAFNSYSHETKGIDLNTFYSGSGEVPLKQFTLIHRRVFSINVAYTADVVYFCRAVSI